MPAILKVQFKIAAQRTTASGGHDVVLVFTQGTSDNAQMIFHAYKCFVFWSRRKDT